MKPIICPRCFTKHDITELAWGCGNSDCPKQAIPVTTSETKPVCSDCGNRLTLRICPECGFLMDKVMENFTNLPISIAGSESAGKSHYLTVLINELRGKVGSVYGFSLMPIGGDDTINQYNEVYYKPLYEENTSIVSTEQGIIRPLIYSLDFDGNRSNKNSTFTFYDACGANFTSERSMSDYNRSLINSSGIILLIDPSQLPVLREKYLKEGRHVLDDDFSGVLSRTISLIRGGVASSEKLDIPVAVCLSKIDTIMDLLDPSSSLRYPSRHLNTPAFDRLDYKACSTEVEALIHKWGGDDIINQLRSHFNNYSFFGFSSLGYPPKDKRVLYLAPHRVEDPFLWILAKNKVIIPTKPV